MALMSARTLARYCATEDDDAFPGGMSSFSAMIGFEQPEDCCALATRVDAAEPMLPGEAGLPGMPTIFSRCSSQ
jgi:hypothetical protein